MHEELSPSDGSLLTRYVSGDREGADVLFGRYQRPLLAYFLRRLGRKDLAEDGLQETFCRLFEQAPRLVEHPRLEAWLFTVARNVSADVCRRRRDRAASFSDLREGGIEAGIAGPAAALPDARFESRELTDLLLRTLGDMPVPEREVFLLHSVRAVLQGDRGEGWRAAQHGPESHAQGHGAGPGSHDARWVGRAAGPGEAAVTGSRSRCEILRPVLVSFAHAEPHPETRDLALHLAVCSDCRQEEMELRETRGWIDAMVAPSAGVRGTPGKGALPWCRSLSALSRLAACAAVVFLARALFFDGPAPPPVDRGAPIFFSPAGAPAIATRFGPSFGGEEIDGRMDLVEREISGLLDDAW